MEDDAFKILRDHPVHEQLHASANTPLAIENIGGVSVGGGASVSNVVSATGEDDSGVATISWDAAHSYQQRERNAKRCQRARDDAAKLDSPAEAPPWLRSTKPKLSEGQVEEKIARFEASTRRTTQFSDGNK